MAFKYLLMLENGEPVDPAMFEVAVPDWEEGQTFTTGRGKWWRTVAIETDIADELVDHGFSGVFTVEPTDKR